MLTNFTFAILFASVFLFLFALIMKGLNTLILQMENVSLMRDGSYILQNINWTVQHGEHWAIIGLNGSGKTTLLKIISGYMLPSKGSVTVLGKRFGNYDLRELRKSIGWVSISLHESLYGNESAEEIVLSGKFASIGLYETPTKHDIYRANEILELFGCSSLQKRNYSTLSQGEKQKIILARALMGSPKILILDEPCTGLDLFARESFLSLIQIISNSANSPTILYVSHHIEEILPLFKKTLLLKDGTIHSAGITKEILTNQNLSNFFRRSVEFSWTNERPSVHINI